MYQKAVCGVCVLLGVMLSGCPGLPKFGDAADGGLAIPNYSDFLDGGNVDDRLVFQDGSVPAHSGLDPSRQVADVTPEEAERVCLAVHGRVTWDQVCRVRAVKDSADEQQCRAHHVACLAGHDPGAEAPLQGPCNGVAIAEELASCQDVTIGDVEACFGRFFAWQRELTCADPGHLPRPPQCFVELQARCPDLHRGDHEEGCCGEEECCEDSDELGDGPRDPQALACPPEADGMSAAATQPVKCEQFCGEVADSGCDDAPSLSECAAVCTEAQRVCPGALSGLVACMAEHEVSWTCSEGELDVPWECGPALRCFSSCVDDIIDR